MKKIKPGNLHKQIDATTYNRMVDVADAAIRNGQLSKSVPPKPFNPPTDVIRAQNNVGADLPRGSVVELTVKIIDELDPAHLGLSGVEPDGTRGFGILRRQQPIDKIDECQVSGVCLALVNVTSTSHGFARVSAGLTVLQSAASGPVRILCIPSGSTGEQECVIVFGAPAPEIGVPFRNDSGYPVPPGGIMSPNSSATIGGAEYVLCHRPSSTFFRRWLVNGPTWVEPEATSLGSWLDDLSGMAAIDPGSASSIFSAFGWGPQPDSFFLFPAWFGFTIEGITTYTVEHDDHEDTTLAHARQHEVNYLIGAKLLETLEYDSHAQARIWRRDHQRERRETQFNPLEVYDGMKLAEGDELEENTRIDIVWNGDAWELANAACATEDDEQSQQSPQSVYGNGVSSSQTSTPSSPNSPAQ